MAALRIVEAGPDDARVAQLLAEAGLGRAGLGAARVWVAEGEDGALLAVGAAEPCGEAALLRSVAVAPLARGQGIGRRLVEAVLAAAREAGAREAYLLTATAAAWFASLGFEAVPRATVPAEVAATSQFAGAACAAARPMRRALG